MSKLDWQARSLRWMYAKGRPNRLAAGMNRFWAWVSALGVWPNRMVTLEVPGRRSGRTTTLPLVVARCEGERYLVSMLGVKADWVANVRANQFRAMLRHGRRERVQLTEVPSVERAPIIRRYLEVAPGARPHIPVDRRASLSEFERIAADYPVFKVESPPAAS